ncbi:hypothetical protein [Actinopolyspora erythraea]|uniref:hypothetical protein n=1 Tax=Actinopolyspora erythraea TaxID=414996 RepID=UPI0011871030|nr:hypothetical protein [Actinopolyspora erythraea]
MTAKLPPLEHRGYPLVNIRRIGGSSTYVQHLDRPSLEVLCISDQGSSDAENIYLDVRQVLYDAYVNQTVIQGAGSIHSFTEQTGPFTFDSPYSGTWGAQGLILLGLRPA